MASFPWQDLIEDRYILLNTTYISYGPHGFRDEDVFFFHFKFMEANDPGEWPIRIPGAWLAGFI